VNRLLWRTPLLGKLIFNAWRLDASRKLNWTLDWISKTDTILEIGSGPGSVLSVFRDAGYSIEGIDVSDSSFAQELAPRLYDGEKMPFEDRQFNVSLLLTMLHHTPKPDDILTEAKRVSKRLIIVEDVYNGPIQRELTKVADSITNLEFIGHPHTNRSDEEWCATFDRLGLVLKYKTIYRVAGYFLQAVYVVDVI